MDTRHAQLRWDARSFDQLDVPALHDLLRLRVDAFVVEQACAYPELDGLDPQAIHLLGFNAENDLVAYCRILPPQADGMPHIGRVVVAAPFRRQGLGRRLMNEAIRTAQHHYRSPRSAVAAQTHLQEFYESLGYGVVGPEYSMDGIPHINMVRTGGRD